MEAKRYSLHDAPEPCTKPYPDSKGTVRRGQVRLECVPVFWINISLKRTGTRARSSERSACTRVGVGRPRGRPGVEFSQHRGHCNCYL